jgi:Rps23 Pro-64 3,4-dihydroxylase Tpa1-like proline 4-hydroxylase
MVDGKTNILEQGMRGISKTEKMPEYIAKIVNYLHSEEFTDKIGELLEIENLYPDKAMRWSGMRVMLPNSFQLIHSDARKSPETGLRKEITCLLYFNKDYDKNRDEGCLEIWTDDMNTRTHEIEPTLNRLVVFLNSDTSFHGVPIVKSERKAITFSILKDGEVTKRSKALFVARPNDSEEVKSEGIKRSQINDAK